MSVKLDEKVEQRKALVEEQRKIQDQADKDKRVLTADEESRWAKIDEEYKSVDAEVARLETLESREKVQSELRDMPEVRGSAAAPQTATEKEERAAFVRAVRSGLHKITEAEGRALSAGSDVDGGYLVTPQQVMAGVITAANAILKFRSMCEVIPLAAAASLGQATMDHRADDFEWTTEIKRVTEDTAMKFGKREMKPNGMRKLIKVSNKLIRLADPVSIIQAELGYMIGVTQEKAYMIGDGAGKPLGIFTKHVNGIPTGRDINVGAITAFTGDHLIEAVDNVRDGYLVNANWVFNKTILSSVRKLKSAVSGDYLWQPGLRSGSPEELLGYGISKSEFAPTAVTSGNRFGVFGNFKYYRVVDAMNMKMYILDQLYQETGQMGYIAEYEGDGQPIQPEAFSGLNASA